MEEQFNLLIKQYYNATLKEKHFILTKIKKIPFKYLDVTKIDTHGLFDDPVLSAILNKVLMETIHHHSKVIRALHNLLTLNVNKKMNSNIIRYIAKL